MKNLFKIYFFFLLLIGSVKGTIINIPADVDSIQGGIDIAVNGDTVLV